MLLTNIHRLYGVRDRSSFLRGKEMDKLPYLENAWLRIKGERIEAFGTMDQLPATMQDAWIIDASGRLVLPAFCDAHTHVVFAGSRESEFVQKIRGATYVDIAAAGGGILSTMQAVRKASEQELFESSWLRVRRMMEQGTGALEIKSGYGLDLANELKLLRVIRRIREQAPIPIRATFLGAHAFPPEYRNDREGYVNRVIGEMIPAIAKEGLADYIDVFCEQGFFSVDQSRRILEAGIKYGLRPKIHANQLSSSGAVQLGVELGALSVDHLEQMNPEDIGDLKDSGVIPTALPGAAYFLRASYPPARAMLDAGLGLAIATDYNPGSAPSGNMWFNIQLACIQMRMTPAEAFNAATINGAWAMEVADHAGSILHGYLANLILTHPIPNLESIPYAFGENPVHRVMIRGMWV
ncbi:MAG TPA: imidazolonepropionase [Saprospiraceae bacterium]|nr:imidazolonepropionase [Saprospiraceae bacterium]